MGNYVDKININGTTADIVGLAGAPYPGVDLTQKFASEINGNDPWAWIRARIRAADFSQIHVGDYIPFTTTNNRNFQAQIAGIDPYYGYADTAVGHHIDFISRELWPDTFQMNLVNFNNGISETRKSAWLSCNGYYFLNSLAGDVPNSTTVPGLELTHVDYTTGGMYYYLPSAIKNVIVEKRFLAQTRWSASGVVSNCNAQEWVNYGKLWLPDEFEVVGARLMTTTGWTSGNAIQYSIFANNMNRAKKANGGRSDWWLSSASAGNTTAFVLVDSYGRVNYGNASIALRAPFCFRVS